MSLSRFTSPVVRLALSQGLAYAGRGAALTALIWVLYQERGAWWVSASMLAVFGVSTLVSPWAGHAGDRHDRRVVVLVSALAAAAGFAVAAPLAAAGLVVPLVLVTVVAASTQGALAAAVQGAVPALVGEDELARANSLAGACKSAGFMLGPGVGGALLALTGAPGVFVAGAALLLGSALLVARLPGSFRAVQPEDGPGGSLDGYRRLMADPWLRLLTIAWTLVMAGVALALRFVPYSDDRGNFDPAWAALMAAILIFAVAASFYVIYVLEILKLRRFRFRQVAASGAPPVLDAVDREVEHELETGEFRAPNPETGEFGAVDPPSPTKPS